MLLWVAIFSAVHSLSVTTSCIGIEASIIAWSIVPLPDASTAMRTR